MRFSLLVTLVTIAVPARAQTGIDLIENLLGASNVGAITGHGRLSIGVSADGDLTVASWPSPSYSDQLGYINTNAPDARERPRFGAPEGSGSFLGLAVETADGSEVTFFHDWQATQSYGPNDGPNPHTELRNDALGLTVSIVDAVEPSTAHPSDVLVRSVRVQRDGDSPVSSAMLLTYANLSPLPPNSRVPELPFVDWAFDGRNDYAAVWDPDREAVVALHPDNERVYDALGRLVSPPPVDWRVIGDALQGEAPSDAELRALLEAYAADEGAFVALTTFPRPDQHQIGFDETDFCGATDELVANALALPDLIEGIELPFDPGVLDALVCPEGEPSLREANGWTLEAEDAFRDLADGELGGASVAAGETNHALRTPLTFEGDVAEAFVVFSFASTLDAAQRGLTLDPAEVAGHAETTLDEWLADRRLPTMGPERVLRVARRSLINLRVGTDAGTGAVVASITRQAPYGLDWPRDGAFFNVALDISGQSELVTQRAALYDEWQRDAPVRPTLLIDPEPPPPPGEERAATYPADAWEMNYYADGMVGGFFRFEIDNTGFSIWTMVAHAGWVDDPAAYLQARWDSIKRAADLLTFWRDPENGLPWPAQEDDNAAYTQGLHGSVTTFGALELASRAARLIGETEDAMRWEERAAELREALVQEFWDPEVSRFISAAATGPQAVAALQNPGSAPTGPTAWLVWPMRVLEWDDPMVVSQLEFDLNAVTPTIRLENNGGGYTMKNTVSLGLAWGADPARRPALEDLRDRLAETTTPTDHFGEVMVSLGPEGDRRASQRVSTPHLWEGTLFYLTAMALEDPDSFFRYEDVLPPSQVPARSGPGYNGGACRASSTPRAGWLGLFFVALVFLRRR